MKRLLFALTLATVAGLTACQEATDVKPIILQNAPLGTRPPAPGDVIAAPQKRLINGDHIQYTYAADGQLKSVEFLGTETKAVFSSVSSAELGLLFPGYQAARGIKMVMNSNVGTYYYLLDDKGVCQRAVYAGPSSTTPKKSYQFSYNASGQLKSITGPMTNMLNTFEYDPNGQLSRVRYLQESKLMRETEFGYKQSNGTYLPNKLRFYPDINTQQLLLMHALPIFGKANDFLPVFRMETDQTTGTVVRKEQISYSLDSDGYILQKQTKNLFTNITHNTPLWVYEIVKPGEVSQ